MKKENQGDFNENRTENKLKGVELSEKALSDATGGIVPSGIVRGISSFRCERCEVKTEGAAFIGKYGEKLCKNCHERLYGGTLHL